MNRLTMWTLTGLAAVLALTAVAPAGASWKRYRGYNGVEQGYVVANSRFGNGSVKGTVRPARYGLQVRLPGGTWVDCRTSCSETLRVETVDLWADQGNMAGPGTLLDECGILGCLGFEVPLP
jgi:hypothetical protein